jgi:hypothetical protein
MKNKQNIMAIEWKKIYFQQEDQNRGITEDNIFYQCLLQFELRASFLLSRNSSPFLPELFFK